MEGHALHDMLISFKLKQGTVAKCTVFLLSSGLISAVASLAPAAASLYNGVVGGIAVNVIYDFERAVAPQHFDDQSWLMKDAQNCSLLFVKIQMSIIAIQKHLEGKSGEKRIAKTKKIRIKNLVKSYSQFGSFPIYTWQEKSRTIEVWAYIHILCTWKRKMKQNCARGRER